MNSVKLGEIYRVANRKLAADAESWEFITTLNDNGKDEITCWISKSQVPTNLDIGKRFRCTKILGYTQKKRKFQKNDGTIEWLPNNSVEIEIEEILELDENPFVSNESPISESNPFAESNPFEIVDTDELPF